MVSFVQTASIIILMTVFMILSEHHRVRIEKKIETINCQCCSVVEELDRSQGKVR